MYKCRTEETAHAIAAENKLSYGMSVFDGAWYVGTVAQLEGVGAIRITSTVE